MGSEAQHYRGRVGSLKRSRPQDDPEYIDAQQGLATAVIAKAVKRALADAPPLRDEQLDRLSRLLRGGRDS